MKTLIRKTWLRMIGVLACLALTSAPAAAQQTSNCPHPDPNDVQQVAECMSSLHIGRAPNRFADSRAYPSCQVATELYIGTLMLSKIPKAEGMKIAPSCEVLAKALTQLRDEPPPWNACLHYTPSNDPAFMKACVEPYVKSRIPPRLGDCRDGVRIYETALKSATVELGPNPGQIRAALPKTYKEPDCSVLAQVYRKKVDESGRWYDDPKHGSADLQGRQRFAAN